jgi:hydroxypyruvate reductase
MKPEILVVRTIYPPALAALEREFTVHRLWSAADPEAFLREVAPNVRGAVTTGLAGFSRRSIEALPGLEIIACFGTPRGTIDLAAAKARGIMVTNTPDAISKSVADLAMGLLIGVMRRIPEGDRFVRAGRWPDTPVPVGRDLGGKTCGIVGLGQIGREVAKRAEACGMSVCYHGPRSKPGVAWPFHPELETLARVADCLVITCPQTPETVGMVDARVLDRLGPEGFLVNVARGAVVDQQALADALREGRIGGAGLDVFWDEPHVPPALLTMDRVVMTPHVGSTTREIRDGRAAKLLANLRAHFAGQPVPAPYG